MFNELKAYSVTEKAGLPWLDSIPSHWHLARVKEILQPIDVRSVSGAEELLTVSSYRGVVPRSGEKVTMFQAATYAGHKLCWPGDLVINSLWAWGGGLGVSPLHGIVSTAYGVYRSRSTQQLDPAYLHSLVRSEPFNWELQYRSRGVWKSRLQLTDDRFLAAPIPLPPLGEQAAIVKYLGHAHARIDRAIASKRKLVNLLEEQKQAIIHQAVTGGLDPSVPFKDSGIPWLGEIPAHWGTVRMSSLLTPRSERNRPDLPLLSVARERGVFIRTPEDENRNFIPDDLSNYKVAKASDLVINKMKAWQGSLGIAPVDGIVSPAYYVYGFHIDEQEFARNLLKTRTYVDQLRAASDGVRTGQWDLSLVRFKNLPMLLPPAPEQRSIIGHLEHVELAATQIRLRVNREIELLREFRTRLTSDVVTGQVDVREMAATLPELTDDLLASADDEFGDEDELIESELELAGADE